MRYYILDSENEPIKVKSIKEYLQWKNTLTKIHPKRGVQIDYNDRGDISISTVFLGLDHSLDGKIPILWETMVFMSNAKDDIIKRYSSHKEALEGHRKLVKEYINIKDKL